MYYLYVAKTKALISFAVTAKLICVFVFKYAKCWFSHDAAQVFILLQTNTKKVGIESVASSDSDDDKSSVTVSYKSSRTGVSSGLGISILH